MMNLTTVLRALVGAGLVFAGTANAAPQKKPYNVLMISVDDMNDWTGFMRSYPSAKTPNIDRLAEAGSYFFNAHAASPLCNPSRTAVLTGMRADHTGIYGNSYSYISVLKDRLTLPRHFRNNGYYTCGSGKLFHSDYCDHQDWDEYLLKSDDVIPKKQQNKEEKYGKARWAKLNVDDAAMDDAKMVNYAIDKLNQKHDRPFFVHCGLYRPHLPWNVPKKYFDMHPLDNITLPEVPQNDLNDIPPAGLAMIKSTRGTWKELVEKGKWKEAVQAYLAAHSFADAQVGRLLVALEQSPYADNTIVLLWGDHGWHLGEKEHWTKNTLWERASRAPLIIMVPGMTKPGSKIRVFR
jgi:arylsulfatase A-like enzyme